MQTEKISRERFENPPDPVYCDLFLRGSFEFQRDSFFAELLDVHRAWAVMLLECEIISRDTVRGLLAGVQVLVEQGPEALRDFRPGIEYFYSHTERFLIDQLGNEVAGELSIGRTRPEPLARMVIRDRILSVLDTMLNLRDRLLEHAGREVDTVMPQWTHSQHAQIATLGHYLVGVVQALERDFTRLMRAYETVNRSTMGCGAVAGTSYPIDRSLVAGLLGFAGVVDNSNDCVASGDYAIETAAAVTNMMVAVSRVCQDLNLWHTDEFDFIEIGDQFCGSSSMMPQKKNPYLFELVRSFAGRTMGSLAGVHAVLHNTYFQDTKDVEEEMLHPVFESLQLAERGLGLLDAALGTLMVKRSNLARAARDSFAGSTELAARIHRECDGISYRTAHRITGDVVLKALRAERRPADVTTDHVDASAQAIVGRVLAMPEESVRMAFDPQHVVQANNVQGGPAPVVVRAAVIDARGANQRDRAWVRRMRTRQADAQAQLTQRCEALMERA